MQGFGRRVCADFLRYIANQSAPAAPTTIYAGYSTAVIAADGSGLAEPTIGTGGYARQAMSWTAVPTPAVGSPAVLGNSAVITWGPSSAAWSTGATPLSQVAYWSSTTLTTEAAFIAAGTLSAPPQVNAANVTLTAAIGTLQLTISQT